MGTSRREKLMKTIVLSAYFVIAFLGVVGSAQAQNNNRSKGICPWPGNLDGAKVAPETHKVIFENEHVRVLEVTIPPHGKEPVHTHCLPSTLYFQQIGDIIVRDPDGKLIFDSRQMKSKGTYCARTRRTGAELRNLIRSGSSGGNELAIPSTPISACLRWNAANSPCPSSSRKLRAVS